MEELLKAMLEGFQPPVAEYVVTLVCVEQGWDTAYAVGKARGIPSRRAAASLVRCEKALLVGRKPYSGSYVYTLTNRGVSRLEWLREGLKGVTSPTGHRVMPTTGRLPFRDTVILVAAGVDTSTAIAAQLQIRVNHASASLNRCWKMGLLNHRREGRRFVYSLSKKGARYLDPTSWLDPSDLAGPTDEWGQGRIVPAPPSSPL